LPYLRSTVTSKTADYLLSASAVAYLLLSFFQAFLNPLTSLTAILVLALNGALAILGLRISISRSYLLFCVFFTFNFLFLSVAPLQQVAADFDTIFLNLGLLRLSSALCLFMTVAGLAAVIYRPYRIVRPKARAGFMARSLVTRPRINYLLLASISGFLTLTLLAFYGSSLLQTSREAFGDEIELDKSLNILGDSFLRPAALITPVVGATIAYYRRNRGWFIVFLTIAVFGVVVNNPLVTARFRSSTLIVFCMLLIFGWYRVRLFLLFYFTGLLASPIFGSVFRYSNSVLDERSFSQFFVHVDFSGLDIFCYTILWADLKGFSYGSNILAGILFFIPRSLWEDKGKTVGEVISDYIFNLKEFGTFNVSAPPPVEGYLSFGVIGAMITSVGVVLLIDWVERRGMEAEIGSPFHFVLCLSPMLSMILLRGPFAIGLSEWCMHSASLLMATALLSIGVSRQATQASPRGTVSFHSSDRLG
jgi:hypothetical protein